LGSGNGKARVAEETFPAAKMLTTMLAETLQDLLHAEGQLVKALPKMAKAARRQELKKCFEQHLAETEIQIERLNEVFELAGEAPKTKACKGMAGLLAEGQEVITESKEKDDVSADLALIAAAQKVEHYEMSAYLSARALASQAGLSQAALLLSQSLLEEEGADKLLNRLAMLLMEGVAVGDGISHATKRGGIQGNGDDIEVSPKRRSGPRKSRSRSS
jgi:Mn-containing catalase